MSFELSLLLFIITANLFLGFLIFSRDLNNKINRSFALLASGITLWALFNFLADNPINPNYMLIWNRLVFAVAFLQGGTLLYFALVFPQDAPYLKRVTKWLILPFSFLLSLFSLFSDFIVKAVDGENITTGVFYWVFIVFMISCVMGTLIILFLKLKKAQGIEKAQIQYIFLGLLLSGVIALSTNLIIPLFTQSTVTGKFGPYSMLLLVGFTAYAVLKHQLFNIKVILTETAVALVVMAIFIQTLISKTLGQGLLNGIILILVIYGGYLIIKSVIREIKFREELQKLSQDLAHANEHLKELDRMKTEFVSLASHELLTPVSAIEGYLSMTLDEKMAKIDDPKAVKYMDRVYTSAKRLARLVTDMLNVSRIEEGRLLVEKHDINLNDLINQVIDELKFKAEEKKQKIIFQGIGGSVQGVGAESQESLNAKRSTLNAALMTYGDPDKIKEVVVNLIGNSIKYSKNPGTITVSIENVPTTKVQEKWQKIEEEIKARPLDDQEAIKSAIDERLKRLVGDEQILIHVKDQGVGIPKEELPRLFKKFHRVGDYTTAESQGTGLGLYISRALVELHHGRIWADSEGPSHGSTFTFSLPDVSSKDELLKMEAQVPQKKEQLKPLARPTKEAEEI